MEFWAKLIERHGLAVAFLFVVMVALYLTARYIVVPLVSRLMAALEKQIEEARAARKEDQQNFLGALKELNETSRGQTRAIEDVGRKVDEMRHRG